MPGWPIEAVSAGWRRLLTATERQDAAWFLAIATRGYRRGRRQRGLLPALPALDPGRRVVPGIGPLGAALIVSNACFARCARDAARAHPARGHVAGSRTAHGAVRRDLPDGVLLPGAVHRVDRSCSCRCSAFWFARRDRWGLAALAGALAASDAQRRACCSCSRSGSRRCTRWRARRPLAAPAARGRARGRARTRCCTSRGGHRPRRRVRALAARSATGSVRPRSPWRTVLDGVERGVAAAAATGSSTPWSSASCCSPVLAGLRRLRPSYSVYALASLAVPLVYVWPVRPLLSMPRFVAVIFPAFWVLARARRAAPDPGPGRSSRSFAGGVCPAGRAVRHLVGRILSQDGRPDGAFASPPRSCD